MSSAETDRRYRFATALIEQGGRFLVTQRCAPDALVGLWEFPSILPGQEPRALAVADFRWVGAADLEQYRFVFADQATTDLLLGIGRESPRLFRHRAAEGRPDQDRAK